MGSRRFGKVEFVYGLSGGLLGQYNASGAAAEEIVWLGDLPIATIQGGAAYAIAPDHLGAPHQIVNSSNTQVWFWNHDPFGNGAPTAAAGFAHRLRFPGQVYDAETGLHSNGHRDYDPRLGRYVESDPIGLAGGINTYVYAGNNPVNAIDPLGLEPKSNEDDAEELPEIDIVTGRQYAQALPPVFFARPPIIPFKELPWGAAGGQGAGKAFPRSFKSQQPDSVPCTYCGTPTTRTPGPDQLNGDHVIPKTQGGNNSIENYTPSCRTCNLEKGPRTPQEWFEQLGIKNGGLT
jgi:RHS repeat-associated protein